MKERPILFSAPMVRALLAGTKTQTRRVVKPQPDSDEATGACWLEIDGRHQWAWHSGADQDILPNETQSFCPYGQPGDRLWVRESHWWFKDEPDHSCGYYPPKLTADDVEYRADGDEGRKVWRPSIHMPRWASRITLEITGVRVERLQDISEHDAQAEGCALECMTPTGDDIGSAIHGPGGYIALWESINGPGSWGANPWVWVLEFKRVEGGAQ
jgi:hypothetical protein